MSEIAVIAIGRNEGERLKRCLASVCNRGMSVVYVDSASTDGSVTAAKQLGAEVVELDMSRPFSAARARNEGVHRLVSLNPNTTFVQFIDGDCEVREGWIDRAKQALEANEKLAAVCGRRRERFPEASVYNRLADIEWETPIGPTNSVGGDSMMRLAAFQQVDGFNDSVVAGEEPELCQRLREKGWLLERIDAEMTWHDAATTRLGQWWKRQVRSGYGMMDVVTRFRHGRDGLFVKQVKSARLWAIGYPVAIVIGFILGTAFFGLPIGATVACLFALALPAQMAKLALKMYRRTHELKTSIAYGFLIMLSKWPFVIGQLQYRRDRSQGKIARMIDYKAVAAS